MTWTETTVLEELDKINAELDTLPTGDDDLSVRTRHRAGVELHTRLRVLVEHTKPTGKAGIWSSGGDSTLTLRVSNVALERLHATTARVLKDVFDLEDP